MVESFSLKQQPFHLGNLASKVNDIFVDVALTNLMMWHKPHHHNQHAMQYVDCLSAQPFHKRSSRSLSPSWMSEQVCEEKHVSYVKDLYAKIQKEVLVANLPSTDVQAHLKRM